MKILRPGAGLSPPRRFRLCRLPRAGGQVQRARLPVTTTADLLCPLCDGAAGGPAFPFATVWNGQRFEYLRCASCRSSFVSPLPTDEQFLLMYGQEAYHEQFYADASAEPVASGLSDVLELLKPGGRLLDFGCGNGAFLRTAQALGFTAEGVELEEQARRSAAAASGRPVHRLDDLIDSGQRFDVIHLGDVLEHLPRPAAMMRRLEALLAPDGRFFIEGPIEDNPSLVLFASRLFGAMKKLTGGPLHGTLPPFHLFRATATAQRAFFERRLGYRVRHFAVTETGWPYRNPGDSLFRPGSVGGIVRQSIGLAAIAAGKLLSGPPLHVGNRFSAFVEPASRG